MSVTTEGQDPHRAEPNQRTREERALFERLARNRGSAGARDELVRRFLPLAHSLAARYKHSGVPLEDLVQVASLGLIKAIDRFDPDRGLAFSSYAVPTIVGEIKRYFRDRTWSVRVPRALQELSMRVDHTVGELADRHGRQPSVAEIAGAVAAEEEQVLEALSAGGAYRAMSFDAPRAGVGGDDMVTLGESVGTDEPGFDRAEERALLAQLMTGVSPRDREVLRLRFEEDRTQAEIGVHVGVSQMQVSRIIRRTLATLRAAAAPPARPDAGALGA